MLQLLPGNMVSVDWRRSAANIASSDSEHRPVRIIVCSSNDLAGAFALNSLRSVFQRHETILVLRNTSLPQAVQASSLHELQFFAADLPVKVFFPLVERRQMPASGPLLTPWEIVTSCKLRLIPVQHSFSDDVLLELIRFAPDLIVSARFGIIFKEPLLSLPRFGIYNFHPGELPAYGGILASFRAMLNCEETTACTVHRVDAGIDTGPIVGVRHLETPRRRCLLWHLCRLYPLGAPLFDHIVTVLEQGKSIDHEQQDLSRRRYYRFPNQDEIDRFFAIGCSFVDFGDYIELLAAFSDAPS